MSHRVIIIRRRLAVIAVACASAVGACRSAPKAIDQVVRAAPMKPRDTLTREMREAMAKAEERRIVDSILAAVRALPPRPVGEPLLAVDDSVNAAQRIGAVAVARLLAPEYRGFGGRSLDAVIVDMVQRGDASRSMPFVACARADTTDLARAQVVLRVGVPDSTGRRSLYRRDYIRRDGRWQLVASTYTDEAPRVSCAAPLPRPTLTF